MSCTDDGPVPVDIHYARLEGWLCDREVVLSKKSRQTYRDLVTAASRMRSLAKRDILHIQRQIHRFQTQRDESLRRIDESYGLEISAMRRYSALLERYGLLTDAVVGSPPLDGDNDAVKHLDGTHRDRFRAAERIGRELGGILEWRLSQAFGVVCGVVRGELLGEDGIVPVGLTCFESFVAEAQRMSGTPSLLTVSELFPLLSHLVAVGGVEGEASKIEGSLVDVLLRLESRVSGMRDEAIDEIEIDFGDGAGAGAGEAGDVIEICWDASESEDVRTIASPSGDPMNPQCCALSQALNKGDCSTIPLVMEQLDLRCALVDELDALRAFLTESAGGILEDVPSPIVESSLTTFARRSAHARLVGRITRVLTDVFEDPDLLGLLRMKSDVPTRLTFIESVERARADVSVISSRRAGFRGQIAEAIHRIESLETEREAIVGEIRELQTRCEGELSKLCAPRPVYIVGDINAL